MDAKQFAWLYLIEHGQAGCKRSYYGGLEIVDPQAKKLDVDIWKDPEAINTIYLKYISIYGVDWKATSAPSNDSIAIFEGTFVDAGRAEVIKGTLVLKNGEKQTWLADAIEITNVFEMMANAAAAEERFKKLFGEN